MPFLNSRNHGVPRETAHRAYTEGFIDEYLIVGLLTTLAINLDLRITSPRTQVVADNVVVESLTPDATPVSRPAKKMSKKR